VLQPRRLTNIGAVIAVSGFVAVAAAEAPPPWSYEGATGPSRWGELSPAYVACMEGSAQSPVDVKGAKSRPLENIGFAYGGAATANAVDNGRTIEWEFPAGMRSINLAGRRYPLIQMHFHSPSEHRVRGRFWPLEMHVVHRRADGSAAVVGILVRRGRRNRAWEPLIRALPAAREREVDGIHLRRLLPSDPRTIRYSGSFTTPPCSEGVRWNLMQQWCVRG
jgi:carbonic anhydrase